MVNVKDLRSFYILRVTPTISNLGLLIRQIESQLHELVTINNERFFVKKNELDVGLLEIELLWETIEEIKTERLSNAGEVITESDKLKKVSNSVIWFYTGSPFIFVFVKGAIYKKVIKLLETVFEDYHVQEVLLQDDFFRELLQSSYPNYITQLTYESPINKQEFMISSISGYGIENSNLWPGMTEGIIKEIKLKMNGVTLKINQRGRVSLFNSPYLDDVKKIIEYLTNILVTSYRGGNSFE